MKKENSKKRGKLRVLAITSGKGGVGKTLLTVHLACALRDLGKDVLIIDGNFGNGNVDIVFGVPSEKTISDVLSGNLTLKEILVKAVPGITIIPAGTGIYEISSPESHHKLSLLSELDTIDDMADIVLIDTPAGITSNVMFFNTSATETVLVTTPEITSVINTISLINVLNRSFGEKEFKLIINMAENEYDAESTFKIIEDEAERFFEVKLTYGGFCPFDSRLKTSSTIGSSLSEESSRGKTSTTLGNIARNLLDHIPEEISKKGQQFFAKRILKEEHDETIFQNFK